MWSGEQWVFLCSWITRHRPLLNYILTRCMLFSLRLCCCEWVVCLFSVGDNNIFLRDTSAYNWNFTSGTCEYLIALTSPSKARLTECRCLMDTQVFHCKGVISSHQCKLFAAFVRGSGSRCPAPLIAPDLLTQDVPDNREQSWSSQSQERVSFMSPLPTPFPPLPCIIWPSY